MWDSEHADSVSRCVSQMRTKEETVHVNTDAFVQAIPWPENYPHVHYCPGTQSPLYFCHLLHKDKMSIIAKPNQYEIPGVHLEDKSRSKNSHQETHRKACCSGRTSTYFEGATLRQVGFFPSVIPLTLTSTVSIPT